jgi:hypothetical protein
MPTTTTPMLDRATLAQLTPAQRRAVLNEQASSRIGELINLAQDGVLDHKNAQLELESPYHLQETFTVLLELSVFALREAIGFERPLTPAMLRAATFITEYLGGSGEHREA